MEEEAAEESTLLDIMQLAAVAKVLTAHIHIVGMIIIHVMHTTSYVCRRDVKKSWIIADEAKARLVGDVRVVAGRFLRARDCRRRRRGPAGIEEGRRPGQGSGPHRSPGAILERTGSIMSPEEANEIDAYIERFKDCTPEELLRYMG